MTCILLISWTLTGNYVDDKPGWYLIDFHTNNKEWVADNPIWVEKSRCKKA